MPNISILVRSEKLQNESFPNFSNFRPEFCPEFCSEFFPNFSWTFRASFGGRRRTEKIHQKSLPFFNAKFPGKHEKNIHKFLLESGQSKFWPFSSAQENHPKMPGWDPQNEFSGMPWIGLSLGISIYSTENPEFPGILRHFLGEGFWGPRIAFSGGDGVDMLGSGESQGKKQGNQKTQALEGQGLSANCRFEKNPWWTFRR